MNWLLTLFRTPSGFPDDPWGYLRNQIGHAYIVGGVGALFLPLWMIAILYAAWEFAQYEWFYGEAWDGVEDMGHVMFVACIVSYLTPAFLAVHALFLISGFLRRKQRG